LLAFAGVPAIYFHSMFGSRGWPEGVVLTGQNRTINRQKLKLAELEYELSATDGLRSQVFQRLSYLLKIRREYAAFDPYSQQSILDVGKGVFALLRFTEKENGGVLCLQNVTGVSQSLKLDLSQTKIASSEMLRDLVSNEIIEKENPLSISMQPYQVIWLLGER
jgi:sucrose phosphorylase